MKKYTIEQYRQMAHRFNNMSFSKKIETIKNQSDILQLGSDYNWWVVKVKDEEIQEQIEDAEWGFDMADEWGSSEMHDLVALIGIDIVDA